jgi:hypothetical protein
MRRIIALAVLCLLNTNIHAQSGRKSLTIYDPNAEVDAIFRAEKEFRARMVDYKFKTRTVYRTPVDNRRFERVAEIGRRRGGGEIYERRKLSHKSTLSKLIPVGRLFNDVLLPPEQREHYHLTKARSEGEFAVYAVEPISELSWARLFRGEIKVRAATGEITEAKGEWVPRWLHDKYAFACTIRRANRLPRSIECDDYLTVRGQLVRVVSRVDYFDFEQFRSEVKVIEEEEEGDAPEP